MSDDTRDDDAKDEKSAGTEHESAKEELFEAIDHFKNAASILFGRVADDPTLKSATKEAERIAKKIGDAAEPLAKQLTGEVSRMTKDILDAVESGTKKKRSTRPPPPKASEEEE